MPIHIISANCFKAALLMGGSAMVTSCTQGVDPTGSLVSANSPFSSSGNEERQDHWWKAFNDPQLNRLIDSALANSPDLLAVWERLQANEALARRERSALFPQLDSTLGASSQGESGNSTDLFSAGLSAGYEVDLWGRIRSHAEAERLRAVATQADYETAALTLSGEVALAWYRLLARKEILTLIEDQITANVKVAESRRLRPGHARNLLSAGSRLR